MTDVKTQNAISLKGSAQLVKEFFHFGLNSILFQRALYPADSFKREKKYGITLYVTHEKKLLAFMEPLLQQVEYWLAKKQLKRLVMVISEVKTKEVVERWQFDIHTEDLAEEGENAHRVKDEKKIRQEISDVLRQITASVSFLPLLEEPVSFDVLIYTGKDTEAPEDWTESGACLIPNSETVQLRSFSTSVHGVNTNVQYKADF
ncbi:CBN-MDF-2 protein [Caenorhabditis brenneri]|uniref:Mitotic spindle assembly checkpoint protein MAD2A n=1 Tax=Caenorhabditis brenneri TaxID=135651 RepID=G0MZW5_CAEBE|nr:CBN-MDF-2 protein [Caenorhabditis brenneri]